MRQVNLKFIGRDLLIGLITASFVYAPNAFAKPNNRAKKKAVPYAQMLKLAKKQGSKSMSEIADAAKPMFKKRGYKLFLKDAMRSWDTKADKMVVGRNYFKFRSGGKVYFGRYVDRGPVAFVLNNKPILWKDVLFYNKFRSRIFNITTGKKLKKVSYLEDFLSYFTKEVYGRGDEGDPNTAVTDGDGLEEPVVVGGDTSTPVSGRTVCISKDEMNRFNSSGGNIKPIRCPSKLKKSCSPLEGFSGVGINVICSSKASDCARSESNGEREQVDPSCNPEKGYCELKPGKRSLMACDNVEPVKPKAKFNWGIVAIIAALLILLLIMKKKKSGSTATPPANPPVPPAPPTPPFLLGGESTCPPVGSRGITQDERDKLPGCNKSNCVEDGTCPGTGTGETVD